MADRHDFEEEEEDKQEDDYSSVSINEFFVKLLQYYCLVDSVSLEVFITYTSAISCFDSST